MKEAAEKALALLKDPSKTKDLPSGSFFEALPPPFPLFLHEVRQSDERILGLDSTNAEELISPISLGMKTKNPKVVALCIGSIQRLVSLGAVSEVCPSSLSLLLPLFREAWGDEVESLPFLFVSGLIWFGLGRLDCLVLFRA